MGRQNKLVIWGASGHARVVADIVRLTGEYDLQGFIDDVNSNARHYLHLPVLGGREILSSLKANGITHILLGFGNCSARLLLAAYVRSAGFELATVIHPHAVIASDAVIGEGTVIAAGAIVNPGCIIGNNVIINTRASVDHDCRIDDGAHICPGVTLGGSVTVRRAAWVGIGSTIKDHVSIGTSALVGAGSVVLTDIPDEVVAYGVPARVRRPNNPVS